MEDISKFIGIPWRFGGDSFSGCDCVGLVRLFYREHSWSNDFTDGKPVTEYHSFGVWRRLYSYCAKHMQKVDFSDLKYGDFVIFAIDGDIHTGVYIGYGKLLAMQVPTVEDFSKSTIYHKSWWKPYFRYAFRRKL